MMSGIFHSQSYIHVLEVWLWRFQESSDLLGEMSASVSASRKKLWKTTLTSRERVLRTFHHVEPDRVPLQYLDNPGVGERLKAHFGLATNDDEGLLDRLEIDFRIINPAYTGPRLHPEAPGVQVDPA